MAHANPDWHTTNACTHNARTYINWNCNNYVSLTASGLDKNFGSSLENRFELDEVCGTDRSSGVPFSDEQQCLFHYQGLMLKFQWFKQLFQHWIKWLEKNCLRKSENSVSRMSLKFFWAWNTLSAMLLYQWRHRYVTVITMRTYLCLSDITKITFCQGTKHTKL